MISGEADKDGRGESNKFWDKPTSWHVQYCGKSGKLLYYSGKILTVYCNSLESSSETSSQTGLVTARENPGRIYVTFGKLRDT